MSEGQVDREGREGGRGKRVCVKANECMSE